ARRWFAIAAYQGNAMAHNMLGRCLEHGWGAEVDVPGAARHYRAAADLGLDWGLYNYANLLATGRGVVADQVQALACYRQAAEAGHAKSMNLLGRYLEEGVACPADPAQARDWYRRSAEAGDFRGQFSHAAMLVEHGQVEQALPWLEQALSTGNLNFLRRSTPTLEQAGDARL
ncbi:MAG: tetratricopeptide repeat protein, partial [Pseudomonas sp.]